MGNFDERQWGISVSAVTVCVEPQDDLDTIHWRGDQTEGLPERVSDIPNEYRHTPPPIPAPETPRNEASPAANEPRRYANPL